MIAGVRTRGVVQLSLGGETQTHEALALYGTMKHLARMPQARSMLPEVRELGALVRTHRVKKRIPPTPTG